MGYLTAFRFLRDVCGLEHTDISQMVAKSCSFEMKLHCEASIASHFFAVLSWIAPSQMSDMARIWARALTAPRMTGLVVTGHSHLRRQPAGVSHMLYLRLHE